MLEVRDCHKPVVVISILLGLVGCPTEDEAKSPIMVLQPKAEARVKAADTLKIMTESDYSKFAGNLSAIYSPDSGKTWDLILSAPHNKTGVARDTFPFVPKDFGFSAGQKVKLEIREYGATGIKVPIGFIHID
jgi:hypothetical protein